MFKILTSITRFSFSLGLDLCVSGACLRIMASRDLTITASRIVGSVDTGQHTAYY